MPLELQLIRASEFICLDPDETLDFAASKKALQTLAHACRKRGLDCALLDLRGLPIPEKPLFTPTQLAALIGTFREAGFGRHQRLAVLYKCDPHGGARAFAFIGRIQGWQVRAFDEFEQAFLWLADANSKGRWEAEAAISIPITKRGAAGKKLTARFANERSGPESKRKSRSKSKRAVEEIK